MRPLRLAAPIVAALMVACSRPSPSPTQTCPSATPSASIATVPAVARPGPSASSAVATSSSVPPPKPPPALDEALSAAWKAISEDDYAAADAALAKAEAQVSGVAHFAFLVAIERATRFVQAGDYERAAAAFVAVMPTLAAHPELSDEFAAHNAMMMIREAQGDPAAALAENDQATLCAERGSWDPEHRSELAFQKDRWHRAYLTRMLAESREGSVKAALVRYAQAALDDYRARGFDDSVAVLEAYFAALDGHGAAALAAARRVDPSKDGDVEDLYLVVLGLEAGGDHEGAEAVRKVMRSAEGPSIARSIMLRWLDLDQKPPTATGFSPLRATRR